MPSLYTIDAYTKAQTDALLSALPAAGLGSWTFDSSTTAADPGAGNFRLSGLPSAIPLELYISQINGQGRDVFEVLDLMLAVDDYVIARGAGGIQNIWKLTSAGTDNVGWLTFSITPVSVGAAIPNAEILELGILPRRASFQTMPPGSIDDLNALLYDCEIGGVLAGDIPKLVTAPGTGLPGLPAIDGSQLTGLPSAIPDQTAAYNWTGTHDFNQNVTINSAAPLGLTVAADRLKLLGPMRFDQSTGPSVTLGKGYLWMNTDDPPRLVFTNELGVHFYLQDPPPSPPSVYFANATDNPTFTSVAPYQEISFGTITPAAGNYLCHSNAVVACTAVGQLQHAAYKNGYGTAIPGADRTITIPTTNGRTIMQLQFYASFNGTDVADFHWFKTGTGTCTLYNRSVSLMKVA